MRTSFYLIVMALNISSIGCNSQNNQNGFRGSSTVRTGSMDSLPEKVANLSESEKERPFTLPINSLIEELKQQVGDDPFEIEGLVFDNVATFLDDLYETFDRVDYEWGSLGELLASRGVNWQEQGVMDSAALQDAGRESLVALHSLMYDPDMEDVREFLRNPVIEIDYDEGFEDEGEYSDEFFYLDRSLSLQRTKGHIFGCKVGAKINKWAHEGATAGVGAFCAAAAAGAATGPFDIAPAAGCVGSGVAWAATAVTEAAIETWCDDVAH